MIQKIKELSIGEIFTYPDLCRFLGENIKRGTNSKQTQFKEWSRFFGFELLDTKILITEIYDTPKEKPVYYPANAIYIECIEKILLSYLSKRKEGITYISSQYLYLALGMINKSYIEMQRVGQKQKLAEILENRYKDKKLEDEFMIIDTDFYVNDFYDRCKKKLHSIIDTSLKSLQRRRLIEYSNVYHMYFEVYDEDGNVIDDYDTYSNEDEIREIISIERQILDLWGYKDEWKVWSNHRDKEYYDLILKEAKELYPGIKKIYRCIKIIYNNRHISNALSKTDEYMKKKELNDKVINFINTQAKDNCLKIEDEYYEDSQYYLSEKLIKIIEQ